MHVSKFYCNFYIFSLYLVEQTPHQINNLVENKIEYNDLSKDSCSQILYIYIHISETRELSPREGICNFGLFVVVTGQIPGSYPREIRVASLCTLLIPSQAECVGGARRGEKFRTFPPRSPAVRLTMRDVTSSTSRWRADLMSSQKARANLRAFLAPRIVRASHAMPTHVSQCVATEYDVPKHARDLGESRLSHSTNTPRSFYPASHAGEKNARCSSATRAAARTRCSVLPIDYCRLTTVHPVEREVCRDHSEANCTGMRRVASSLSAQFCVLLISRLCKIRDSE